MNNSQNILKVLSTYQPHFQDFIVKNILHINNVPRLFVNNSDGEYDDISLLKSGKVDMIFPDGSLSFLDGTEVNISVGPVVGGVSCVFWNIYPNSSTDVINKGILSSLEIVNHSVFIFAVLLTVLALIIYFVQSDIGSDVSTLYPPSIIKYLLANIKGQYFERLAALFYHKNIDGDKKRRIIRASYSGLEQKLWTVGSEKMLETRDDAKIERLLFPMCWRYEELGAQPEGSYSPITYSNFTDLMYLYLSLSFLAIILFLLEVFLIKFKSQN
ncbi:uncharacterized protein LOC128397800 [Panonychus citri]|uniref:uncharacterized protein LOC128397800 n=1 Tax=Panonychus citri TaxID=50023 RepID=UPI0023072A23|nr:uncharacterized protein LOC128397800 [Panonychus citri]